MEEEKKIDHINLRVKGNGADSQEVFFKIKRTTPLQKLFNAYCEKQGKALNTVRFLFEGERLSPTDTPEKYNMENEDIIEVVAEQQGGC